jgi:hypothetical protein
MSKSSKIDKNFKNCSMIKIKKNNSKWCYADSETRKKIISFNQNLNNFIFIKGDV